MRTLLALAAAAALASCGQPTTTETPDTTAETEMPPPAAPAATVTLTEADARARAETAGYTNITGLTQNADDAWTATGTMSGQTSSITISDTGVTAATTPAPTP